jgi:hypothetical protein
LNGVKRQFARDVVDGALRIAAVAMATIALWLSISWLYVRLRNALAPGAPVALVEIGDAATLGEGSAKFALLILSDFECEKCRFFAREVLPKITQQYVDTGQLEVAFRYLDSSQSAGSSKALIATCLERMGSFWSIYRQIAGASTVEAITEGLVTAKLPPTDARAYEQCLRNVGSQQIMSLPDDISRARLARLSPAFLFGKVVNGRQIEVRASLAGGVPMSEFERLFVALGMR